MKNKTVLRMIILLSAVSLLTAGILTGGINGVKNKAAMICMECIGLG